MDNQELLVNVFPLDISETAPIDAGELMSFSKGAVNSIAAIAEFINTQITPVIATLPKSFTPGESRLDGTGLYVDSSATDKSDSGLFYYEDIKAPQNSRPLTIHEALLGVMQILANQENGLREGLRIGSGLAPVAIAQGQTKIAEWPYKDRFFSYKLYEASADGVITIAKDIEVFFKSSDGSIYIDNKASSAKSIFGYIWHPVFNF